MSTQTAPDRQVAEESDRRVVDIILAHADTRPDDDALICGDERLSQRQFRENVLALAGAIAAKSSPGNRVVLLGDTGIEMAVAYFAIIAAGQCAVPLPVSAHAQALAGMIGDCEPGLIFANGKYLDLLGEADDTIKVVRLGDEKSELKTFAAQSTPLAAPVTVGSDDPFNIIYSSGTTGRPKGIVHSHEMRYRQTARDVFKISPASTMLLAMPFYSNATLMPLLMALFHGGRVVFLPKFDAEKYLDLAEEYSATHTMLVPVQYQRILAAESFPKRDLSRFEVKQTTGAPMSPADKLAVARQWPGRFLGIYGLTEGGCTCILDVTAHPDKAHTVGKPAPGNDVRVVDEHFRPVPAGERGEVIGRSRTMMSGYFRNPKANEAFYWYDEDGVLYFRTGDIGVFDEDGFLTLVDRMKDMIISGGFNIYASDLEEKLLEHPDVAEASVIAVPSEKWGETPLGIVVRKPSASIGAGELLEWVNAQLGRTQRLSAVEFRNELPRSTVGKILKQELKKPYWEKADGR